MHTVTVPGAAVAFSRVLILKADRVYSDAIRQVVELALPRADVRTAHNLAEARAALRERPVDLLLAGFGLPDGDVLALLGAPATQRGWRRALIVTGRKEERVLALLRAAPIAGVFDPNEEDSSRLVMALQEVMAGCNYWSSGIVARLRRLTAAGGPVCRRLTPIELLVFYGVSDGSDDIIAAASLGMKPSSVKSVRGSLHEKLGVQHRGELMRLAAQKGMIHFTADGIHRPGFAPLLAHQVGKRRGRRGPLPPAEKR